MIQARSGNDPTSAGVTMRSTVQLILSITIAATACSNPRDLSKELKAGTGFVQVPGGRVWYNVVGTGHRTPLLVLHGGPGGSSYYLKPLGALGDDRPVIFYDQLGGGHSDKPMDSTLWTMTRFVQEITAVREALGLERVHILGHSFGTLILADYMKTKPKGVRSIIFASPVLDVPGYMQDAANLLKQFPDSIRRTITDAEKNGTTNSPAYQNAMMAFYHEHFARKQPWSADVDSLMTQLNPGPYVYMQGPSEFTITGTLKNYNQTASLKEITVPTLFLSGQYDEAVPARVEEFQKLTPGAKLEIVPNAAHLTMQDQPEVFLKILREWLRKAEE